MLSSFLSIVPLDVIKAISPPAFLPYQWILRNNHELEKIVFIIFPLSFILKSPKGTFPIATSKKLLERKFFKTFNLYVTFWIKKFCNSTTNRVKLYTVKNFDLFILSGIFPTKISNSIDGSSIFPFSKA